MKVGMAVDVAAFVGGVEQQVFDLGVALRERGHEVHLLFRTTGSPDGERFRHGFNSVSKIDEAGALSRLDLLWVHRPALLDQLDTRGAPPVLVSVHDHALSCPRHHRYLLVGEAPCHRDPGPGCLLKGCVIARRPGWPGLGLVDPWATRRRVKRLAEQARLVACSAYVASGLVGAGAPADRVTVLAPVPAEHAAPLVALPRENRLLAVGQLVHGKGFDLAINALALLPNNVTLELVGSGALRGSLETLAARVAPGRVRFAGWLDAERVRARYDAARVVLVPSRWPEPFGMVGLEAMRRGRAVVAARHGGIPEWLPKGLGALVDPCSVPSLAQGIAAVLLGAEGEGERARVHAEARFGFAQALDRVERLLLAEA